MTRILIVDEPGSNEASLRHVLKDVFGDVACANTGVEALELATSNGFDIAFINTNLPDMDGVNLVRYLAAYRPGILPVVMTANRSYYSALAALEAGACRYMLSPFDTEVLPSRIVRETMAERVLLLRRRFSLRLVDLGRERHLLESDGRVSPVTAIVVDPDEEGGLKLTRALRSAGCIVKTFSNAREALKNLEPSEILAMHNDMGDLKAVDALRKLKARRGIIEAMIFGGQPSLEEIVLYVRYGASAYVERHLESPDIMSYLMLRHGRAAQVNKYVGSLERLSLLLPQIELGSCERWLQIESTRPAVSLDRDSTAEAQRTESGSTSGDDLAPALPREVSLSSDDDARPSGRVRPSPGYYSKTPGVRRSKPSAKKKEENEEEEGRRARFRPSVGFYHINKPDK